MATKAKGLLAWFKGRPRRVLYFPHFPSQVQPFRLAWQYLIPPEARTRKNEWYGRVSHGTVLKGRWER